VAGLAAGEQEREREPPRDRLDVVDGRSSLATIVGDRGLGRRRRLDADDRETGIAEAAQEPV
jgi:hypothetical protein